MLISQITQLWISIQLPQSNVGNLWGLFSQVNSINFESQDIDRTSINQYMIS